jgi:hypothetical protein
MPRRPLPIVLALAACLCVAPAPAGDLQKLRRQFAAHCESALFPNFVIPLKSIANRDGLHYGDGAPDASGTPTLATLERPAVRIVTRFGQPNPNDVEVTQYGAPPNRQDEDAFGRIVALFRFCDPLR